MGQKKELGQIKQMLSAGRLTIPDLTTGYHRSLYACCPEDGNDSPVHRIDRSGEAITQVVFRCPICSGQFSTAPENMFLR